MTWAAATRTSVRRLPKRCTTGKRPTIANPIQIHGTASDTKAEAMSVPIGSVLRFARFVAVEATNDRWSGGVSPYAYTDETAHSAMMKKMGTGKRLRIVGIWEA